jgi:hypothetical protein
LLEQYSDANRDDTFAVFSRFIEPPGHKLMMADGWPPQKLSSRCQNGLFTFTPDASREDAIEIARGLTDNR